MNGMAYVMSHMHDVVDRRMVEEQSAGLHNQPAGLYHRVVLNVFEGAQVERRYVAVLVHDIDATFEFCVFAEELFEVYRR
jgi:hypothetical protein